MSRTEMRYTMRWPRPASITTAANGAECWIDPAPGCDADFWHYVADDIVMAEWVATAWNGAELAEIIDRARADMAVFSVLISELEAAESRVSETHRILGVMRRRLALVGSLASESRLAHQPRNPVKKKNRQRANVP